MRRLGGGLVGLREVWVWMFDESWPFAARVGMDV